MKRIRSSLMTLLLVLALVATATTASGLEVQIKKTAMINGEHITVGEIATLIPATSPEALALAGKSLGRAPEPGQLK